jgi:hypothetical protein
VKEREGRHRPRGVCVRLWNKVQISRANRFPGPSALRRRRLSQGAVGGSRAPCPGTLSSCARRGKPRRHGPPPPCSSPTRSAPRHHALQPADLTLGAEKRAWGSRGWRRLEAWSRCWRSTSVHAVTVCTSRPYTIAAARPARPRASLIPATGPAVHVWHRRARTIHVRYARRAMPARHGRNPRPTPSLRDSSSLGLSSDGRRRSRHGRGSAACELRACLRQAPQAGHLCHGGQERGK